MITSSAAEGAGIAERSGPASPVDGAASALAPWNDPALPVDERVDALVAAMTLREKLGQLHGFWVGASNDGGDVAPFQYDMNDVLDLGELAVHGIGQLTRPFGTHPIDPAVGVASLAATQRRIAASNRFGIPAIAHEECLAGFTAWTATAYPVPLSWGATFDPELIERMAARIGASMRSVGVHQGLAPVLDVVRDARWGRVEETIGEDPHLVATVATAYVRGLQSAGIVATLKHFAGYSASRAGRNLAPAGIGAREVADVLLPPFELAIRDGGAGSVMHAYTDIDGVPSASDESLLTDVLRGEWGFGGTVVADYGGVRMLTTQHRVAASESDAAAQALRAGVDVELPNPETYLGAVGAVESGLLDETMVDRAVRRVLAQKIQLGLLDPSWSPVPDGWTESELADVEAIRGTRTLDTDSDRALAREVAERAVVLLANDGTLPIADGTEARPSPRRIAVIGPCGDDPFVLVGCYAFPNHVLDRHPATPVGIDLPTLADAVRTEFPGSEVLVAEGVPISGEDASGIDAAVALAREVDLVIAAVGDRAGLFGRGTSGEGCDAFDLELPGRQWPLLDALLDAGTPVVATVISGRPYTLHDTPERAAAVLQAFLPGEEGSGAVAGVISGRVRPAGRLPVSVPAHAAVQPNTYLASPLARRHEGSNIDPSARFPFGFGLGYEQAEWSGARLAGALIGGDGTDAPLEVPTDGRVSISVDLRNPHAREVRETVQVYLHDPVASVVRPDMRLVAYRSVVVPAGGSRCVEFEVAADLAAFTGRDGVRIVEPGRIELRLSASSADPRFTALVDLVGPLRRVGHDRELVASSRVLPLEAEGRDLVEANAGTFRQGKSSVSTRTALELR